MICPKCCCYTPHPRLNTCTYCAGMEPITQEVYDKLANACRIMTEANDKLMDRVQELVEEKRDETN